MPDREIVILVVEDEPLILLNALDFIEQEGMVALGAANAVAALALLEKRPDIQLMFTDIDLPGAMDGLALAEKVRQRWPQINIVFTSGHILDRSVVMPADSFFVSKPYLDKQVLRLFHSILNPAQTALSKSPISQRS